MQKKSKTKVISILTIIAMLLSTCFIFASCDSNKETTETLKYSITITGENDELLCNLTDIELTGSGLTITDATQNACEILELNFVVADDGLIEQIGNLKNGIQNANQSDEVETDENGEEVTTEEVAGDYYFWEFSVNGTVLETGGPSTTKLKEGDKISWKWTIYDETAG